MVRILCSSAWYDQWDDHGPLCNITNGMSDSAVLADMISDGRCNWPNEWYSQCPELRLLHMASNQIKTYVLESENICPSEQCSKRMGNQYDKLVFEWLLVEVRLGEPLILKVMRAYL
ncbi:hypothetical protein Tco_1033926 [Tanacetum coccineum]